MTRERDPESLAAAARGPLRPADLTVPVDDERGLIDLLDPDEQPHYLLEGTILDVVRHGDGEEDDRTRKMAPPDGGVYALVTDDGARLVVSYGDHASAYAVRFDELRSASLRTLGSDRRLRLAGDGTSYDLYPEDDGAACEAVVEFVNDRIDSRRGDGDRDPLERLERLADLRDRGALTEAEFDEKKRDLLDEI